MIYHVTNFCVFLMPDCFYNIWKSITETSGNFSWRIIQYERVGPPFQSLCLSEVFWEYCYVDRWLKIGVGKTHFLRNSSFKSVVLEHQGKFRLNNYRSICSFLCHVASYFFYESSVQSDGYIFILLSWRIISPRIWKSAPSVSLCLSSIGHWHSMKLLDRLPCNFLCISTIF